MIFTSLEQHNLLIFITFLHNFEEKKLKVRGIIICNVLLIVAQLLYN